MKNKIKVGFLVSYDYEYLKISLPLVYSHANQITLAIDKDRKTWNGERINIKESFFDWVKEFDIEEKIVIYEDSFYMNGYTSMACETRERNMLAEFMSQGGWHIQLDVDEYFLDFMKFSDYLNSLDFEIPTIIYANWITIFKQTNEEVFIIDSDEIFPLATNYPVYKIARNTKVLEKNLHTDFEVLHQSWGREEKELLLKLRNWGHNNDFETNLYFNLWKAIDKHTYTFLSNFHPTNPKLWKSLKCFKSNNISDLVELLTD